MIPIPPGVSVWPIKPCGQKHGVPEQVTPRVQFLKGTAGVLDDRLDLSPAFSRFIDLMLFQGVRPGGQIRHGAAADIVFLDLRTDSPGLEVIPFRSAFVPSHRFPPVVSPQFRPSENAVLAPAAMKTIILHVERYELRRLRLTDISG